ncbi:nuclear transport factor 2 family protein [uncultured Polaribacter sp.]|uniref:YybH family protein n=1 Tax=uncultured Polaribacter sp. TaxID=174711 RepID=UPI00259B50DA|nr:nuclear transport factor 2 family protein [uncultured Polaribacter sp.]
MELKKSVLLILLSFAIISSCKNKEKVEVETSIKEVVIDIKSEKQLVENVMKSYKDAIQNLTTEGTFVLFTPDATVFEQGKVEGTYKDYIDHHLGPELGHFKSFTFSDYEIHTTVNLPYAYTTENYLYTIVLKGDEAKGTQERTVKSKGVATSILQKINGMWKIIHSHTSFRKIRS